MTLTMLQGMSKSDTGHTSNGDTSRKGIGTEESLSQVYSGIQEKLFNLATSQNKFDSSAQELENFLNQLKEVQAQIAQGNDVASVLKEYTYGKLFEILDSIIGVDKNGISKLLGLNLLNSKKLETESRFAHGSKLEQTIARIIKGMNVYAQVPQNSNWQKYIYEATKSGVGSFKTNISMSFNDLEEIVQEKAKQMILQGYSSVRVEFDRATKTATLKADGVNIVYSVDGKIDNLGLSAEIKVGSVIDIAKPIIEALREATFTDKNYLGGSSVEFGDTNPYRVYATYISERGRWNRFLNCLYIHQNSNVFQYFWKMRIAYEISGLNLNYIVGKKTSKAAKSGNIKALRQIDMIDTLNKIGYAKYLILNTANRIRVISTPNIILDLYKEIERQTRSVPNTPDEILFSPITISTSKLLSFK